MCVFKNQSGDSLNITQVKIQFKWIFWRYKLPLWIYLNTMVVSNAVTFPKICIKFFVLSCQSLPTLLKRTWLKIPSILIHLTKRNRQRHRKAAKPHIPPSLFIKIILSDFDPTKVSLFNIECVLSGKTRCDRIECVHKSSW